MPTAEQDLGKLESGRRAMSKFTQYKKLEIFCTFGWSMAGTLNHSTFFWIFLLLGAMCFALAEYQKWKPHK